jgi:hypothetical protein
MRKTLRTCIAFIAVSISLGYWCCQIDQQAVAQEQADLAAPSRSVSKLTYEKAVWIFNHAIETHYLHEHEEAADQVVIDGAEKCTVDADCSGFVSYLLSQEAPKQYESIIALQPKRDYPQAKSYVRFFQSLSSDAPTGGWLGVKSYRDLRRGDIIAWAKPPAPEQAGKRRGNTGHVMIASGPAGTPETTNVDGQPVRFVPVAVIDCSSVNHFRPEVLPPQTNQDHRDGLGMGTVRLIVDDNDNVIGYWEGTYSNESQVAIHHPTYSDLIAFARLERIQ